MDAPFQLEARLPDQQKKRARKPARSSAKASSKRTKTPRKRGASAASDLFTQVVAATGIPAESIENELRSLLERRGVNVERLTLAQLRAAVAQYLREVMGEILERTHRPPRTT